MKCEEMMNRDDEGIIRAAQELYFEHEIEMYLGTEDEKEYIEWNDLPETKRKYYLDFAIYNQKNYNVIDESEDDPL